jgi:MFS family permease
VGLRDRITDPNIFRIYVATFGLGLAYGMAISLIGLFLNGRGFSEETIGQLAAWFAAGIMLLALPMGALIQRFSAKTTLVCSLVGYAFTVSVFPYLDSYASIAAVRLIDGACSVGVWVSSETILLSRAGRKHKAFVTSLYATTIGLGYVGGPLSARALSTVAPFSVAFVVAGALALVVSIYVLLAVDRDLPQAEPHEAHDHAEDPLGEAKGGTVAGSSLALVWRIKNSCYATFAYGYFQASVVLLLPLYMVKQKGIPVEQTILNPAYFAAGMLLFANVGGRLGDRFGHLGTMRLLAGVGLTMILGFVYLDSYVLMAAAVFVAGATLATISPLSLALQGVAVHHSEYARANAIYNVFYGAGMLLGPAVSGVLFTRYGGAMMLYTLAALWVGFVVFSIVFYRDDPRAAKRVLSARPAADVEPVG